MKKQCCIQINPPYCRCMLRCCVLNFVKRRICRLAKWLTERNSVQRWKREKLCKTTVANNFNMFHVSFRSYLPSDLNFFDSVIILSFACFKNSNWAQRKLQELMQNASRFNVDATYFVVTLRHFIWSEALQVPERHFIWSSQNFIFKFIMHNFVSVCSDLDLRIRGRLIFCYIFSTI